MVLFMIKINSIDKIINDIIVSICTLLSSIFLSSHSLSLKTSCLDVDFSYLEAYLQFNYCLHHGVSYRYLLRASKKCYQHFILFQQIFPCMIINSFKHTLNPHHMLFLYQADRIYSQLNIPLLKPHNSLLFFISKHLVHQNFFYLLNRILKVHQQFL